MNEALREVFAHNSWATSRLLAFCATLPESVLASAAVGTFGTVIETFVHIVGSDAAYLRVLSGAAPSWTGDGSPDLAVLAARTAELAPLWETFLREPVDADRVLVLDKGTYEVNAGVVVAQAVHHGNAHREQICAILTSLGLEPPDLQPWAFADETSRSRTRAPNE